MILTNTNTNTNTIEGRTITAYKGIVVGEANMGATLSASGFSSSQT